MGRGKVGEGWLMTPDCQMTLWVWTLAGHLKLCQQPLGTAWFSLTLHLTEQPWSFYCYHHQGNLHHVQSCSRKIHFLTGLSLLWEAVCYWTVHEFIVTEPLLPTGKIWHVCSFKCLFCKPIVCAAFCGLIRAVTEKRKYLFWDYNHIIKYFAHGKICLILTGVAFLELYKVESY